MRHLNLTRHSVASEPWVNEQTARVDGWLMDDAARAIVERLVWEWNQSEGLGVDLADELRDLVEERLKADHSPRGVRRLLHKVSWNQLAEQYALRIVGVDEPELERRYRRQLRREA